MIAEALCNDPMDKKFNVCVQIVTGNVRYMYSFDLKRTSKKVFVSSNELLKHRPKTYLDQISPTPRDNNEYHAYKQS